jgi:Zn-dependent protease with chaperone function
VFCEHCGLALPAGAPVCPRCGAPVEHPPPQPPPDPADRIRVRYPGAGRTPRGPGARAVLGAVLLRNVRGTVAGIFGAWFNVPFTVMMGAAGAVIGAVTGAVNGTFIGAGMNSRINTFLTWIFPIPVKAEDLLPTAGAQIGGIIGAILGGLNGAWTLGWMAFVWPWQKVYESDPIWPVGLALGQVVVAVVVGFLFVAYMAIMEPFMLKVSGARRLSEREAAWIMPLVYEAAGRMGLTSLPRVLIDDRSDANAHAGIGHIVINRGLIVALDYRRTEVVAVIAHELAHWRNGDAVAMAWSKGVALPLYVMYELGTKLLQVTHVRPLHFLLRFLFWSILFTTERLVLPVQAATWREAEYRADAAAAQAGYGHQLRRALILIHKGVDGARSGWERAILAMHPPLELRLERLESRPHQTYGLSDYHPIGRVLPSWTPDPTVEKDR